MRRPRTLVGRLFVWQVAVVLVLLAAFGVALDRILERDALENLTDSLTSHARSVRAGLPASGALQDEVVRLARAGAVRITVIATDGTVLAESERDPAELENHADRPEVRAALAGEVGIDARLSESVDAELLYVALPPEEGRIIRVAYPLTRFRAQQTEIRLALSVGLLAVAAAAAGGVLLVSREVSRPLRGMTEALGRTDARGLPGPVPSGGTEELEILAGTLNSMAARLRSEMEASEEEQRTRERILSSMEEGVVLAGPDGDVTYANAAAERHLGARPTSLRHLAPAALAEAAVAVAAGSRPESVEVQTGVPPRWIRCSFVPVGADGSALLVIRDVTQARRLEAVRRDFVANASHELKTPAASIQAAAETIRAAAEDDPAVVPEFATRLEREAVRLSRIVSDLLDLSRLESGTEQGEPVRLDAVVRAELDRFHDPARRAGVELSIDAGERVTVRGSRRDLGLLVRNLIDNAVRYTAEGGRIDVRLSSSNGASVLTVADSGIGIPSRDLPRVFERFYRVDRARSRETGGTGLGLSIVKHVTENHGGSVEVRSELGRGTTFEVRLPTAS